MAVWGSGRDRGRAVPVLTCYVASCPSFPGAPTMLTLIGCAPQVFGCGLQEGEPTCWSGHFHALHAMSSAIGPSRRLRKKYSFPAPFEYRSSGGHLWAHRLRESRIGLSRRSATPRADRSTSRSRGGPSAAGARSGTRSTPRSAARRRLRPAQQPRRALGQLRRRPRDLVSACVASGCVRTAARQRSPRRRRQSRPRRRVREPRRRFQRAGCRARGRDRRPADRARDHARDPQDHLGLVADRPRQLTSGPPTRRYAGVARRGRSPTHDPGRWAAAGAGWFMPVS